MNWLYLNLILLIIPVTSVFIGPKYNLDELILEINSTRFFNDAKNIVENIIDNKIENNKPYVLSKRLTSNLKASNINVILSNNDENHLTEMCNSINIILSGYGSLKNKIKRREKIDHDVQNIIEALGFYYNFEKNVSHFREEGEAPALEEYIAYTQCNREYANIELLKVFGGCLNEGKIVIEIMKKK